MAQLGLQMGFANHWNYLRWSSKYFRFQQRRRQWLNPPTLSIQETQDPNRWFPHDWREHALDLLGHDAWKVSKTCKKICSQMVGISWWWISWYDSLKSHRKKTHHSSNYPIWVPGTQMTLVLIGSDLVLKGSTTKIEDKQVPGTFWVVPLPNFLIICRLGDPKLNLPWPRGQCEGPRNPQFFINDSIDFNL